MNDENDLSTEVNLLLALDQPHRLSSLASRCDWGLVDHLVREQRLAGRLLRALHEAGARDTVPDELWMSWKAQARRAALACRQAVGQIERLSAAFGGLGIEPCLLKGPVLILLGLSGPSERPFGDLDLLVPRDRLDEVARAMHELGYGQQIDASRRQWARMSHYHDPRWVHPTERFPVEIHWDIARPGHPLAFETDTLTTVELRLPGGSTLLRLDDADLLSHVCLHFWGDRAAGKPHGIGQLWDIAAVSANLDEHDWEQLWERAARRGHRAVLGVALATVSTLLDKPELERFPAVAAQADRPELAEFAVRRVCARRPPHVQLLAPYDDVHFGVGRFLKQRFPWTYAAHSPLRWWPSVILVRLAAAALRSSTALGQIYGTQPSFRLRLSYLRELIRLLGRALRQPRSTTAELRIDRWAVRIMRSRTMTHHHRDAA